MRISVVAAILFFTAMPARAQTIDKPTIAARDTWTYQSTFEKGPAWRQAHEEVTIVRFGSSDMLVSIKEIGSPAPAREQLVGLDWSRVKSVNGKQTVVNQPLDFPIFLGKKWRIEFKENHPNREHAREETKENYVAAGWETVTVPAGTFKALKIESEGEWTAELAPAVATASGTRTDSQGSTAVIQTNKTVPKTIAGRLYKAFWYVPEVKRFVKNVEETYDPSGVRVLRSTDELEGYKLSP
jgi:hypothetical protein